MTTEVKYTDRKGKPIAVGAVVRWRGRYYDVLNLDTPNEVPSVVIRLQSAPGVKERVVCGADVDVIKPSPVAPTPTAAEPPHGSGLAQPEADDRPDADTQPRHIPITGGQAFIPGLFPGNNPKADMLSPAQLDLPLPTNPSGFMFPGAGGGVPDEPPTTTSTTTDTDTDNTTPDDEHTLSLPPEGGALYPESSLTPYSLWMHLQSKSLYVVVGPADNSTNGEEDRRDVVYYSLTLKRLKTRRMDEFLDGRFVPISC